MRLCWDGKTRNRLSTISIAKGFFVKSGKMYLIDKACCARVRRILLGLDRNQEPDTHIKSNWPPPSSFSQFSKSERRIVISCCLLKCVQKQPLTSAQVVDKAPLRHYRPIGHRIWNPTVQRGRPQRCLLCATDLQRAAQGVANLLKTPKNESTILTDFNKSKSGRGFNLKSDFMQPCCVQVMAASREHSPPFQVIFGHWRSSVSSPLQ